jgi:hypothetical protein
MKAVLHTGGALPWAAVLGRPWPLLPVGNRPWIEYWIEWCVEQDIRSVQVILGEGAWAVEQYLGDGARWGLQIGYSFVRDERRPEAYLRRNPSRWREGLFFLGEPLFPRRGADYRRDPLPAGSFAGPGFVFSRDPAFLDAFLATGSTAGSGPLPPDAIAPAPLASLQEYYALNMSLVRGETARYLAPGYASADGAYLGLNVVYPPSARLNPPVMIGDHVRLRGLCTIGPDAVLGNRIIVDRQADVRESVILDGTYLGAGIEVRGRIVAGRRLIDPADGTALDVTDAHLLSPLRPAGAGGDAWRNLLHRVAALVLFALLAAPWLAGVVLGLLAGGRYHRVRRLGRRGPLALPEWRTRGAWGGWLARLSLDVWPQYLRVLSGDLWLCGQLPPADADLPADAAPGFPAVFSRADARPGRADSALREIEDAYYAHHRSLGEDLAILARAWSGRLTGRPWAEPGP